MKDDEASMNPRDQQTRRHYRSQASAKVVRSDPSRRIEIPPVWANSNATVDAVIRVQLESIARAFWMEWPLRRGIRTRYIRVCNHHAELLTTTASGTSRRNVSGAIADDKNDRNFPQRRQLS